jgi:hypothetical protein
MGKLLLNLTLGEPLALVKKLSFFDEPIELDVILVDYLHIGVHDLIKCIIFNAAKIDLCRGQVLSYV